MNMSYDSSNLTTPDIKWLGVRPSDLDRFNIPQQCRLPMTEEDIKTGKVGVAGIGISLPHPGIDSGGRWCYSSLFISHCVLISITEATRGGFCQGESPLGR